MVGLSFLCKLLADKLSHTHVKRVVSWTLVIVANRSLWILYLYEKA